MIKHVTNVKQPNVYKLPSDVSVVNVLDNYKVTVLYHKIPVNCLITKIIVLVINLAKR